jgi:high-affinity nickel permease
MLLVDTSDGILMLGAYGWADKKPIRKLFYNLIITLVSVLVALIIGGIEVLGLVGGHFGFEGSFWVVVSDLNGNLGALGFGIVALVAVTWLASMLIDRLKDDALRTRATRKPIRLTNPSRCVPSDHLRAHTKYPLRAAPRRRSRD